MSQNRRVAADLDELYTEVELLLRRYSPPFSERSGGISGKRDYQLWSEKDVVIEGRKKSEVYFAGVIRQKAYVGFYYMPVYTDPERRDLFSPELLRLLKGKSCFHLKRLGAEMLLEIESALDEGVELYRRRGWV